MNMQGYIITNFLGPLGARIRKLDAAATSLGVRILRMLAETQDLRFGVDGATIASGGVNTQEQPRRMYVMLAALSALRRRDPYS